MRLFRRAVSLFILCGPLLEGRSVGQSASGSSFRALPGYVVEEHFSALRQQPGLTGRIIERMRRGRFVAVLPQKRVVDGVTFWRVAISRRRRGWVCQQAFVIAGRSGDDERLLRLVEAATGFPRLMLAHILVTQFPRSSLRPRALLILGEEADKAAEILSREVKRQDTEHASADKVTARQWYLNDERLDRYNRLGILFEYDEAARAYRYEGWAYREIVRRYPQSPEALRAAEWLKETARPPEPPQ